MDSSENPKPTQPEQKKSATTKSRPKRWLRVIIFFEFLFISALFAVIAIFIGLYASDTGIRIPTWVDTRVQSNLNAEGQEINVTYADAHLKLEDDFRPKIVLSDAAVTNTSGEIIARLSELQVKLTRASILRGDPKIQTISATGLYATVRRTAEGTFNWSLAQEGAVSVAIPSLQDIDLYLERLFDIEALSDLKTIRLDPITIRYEDVNTNRAYTADGGLIEIIKEQNSITASSDVTVLSDQGDVSRALVKFQSPLASQQSEFSVAFDEIALRDLIVQSQYFGVMSPVSGAAALNLRLSVDADGMLSPLNVQLSIEDGAVNIPQTPQIPFDKFQAYLTVYPDQERLDIVQLTLDSPSIKTELSAQIQIDQSSGETELYGSLSAGQFELTNLVPQIDALALRDVSGHFKTSLSQTTFDVMGAQAKVNDTDGQVFADIAWDGQSLTVDATVRGATRQDILAHWPKDKGRKAYDWIDTRLTEVSLGDVRLAARYNSENERPISYMLSAPVIAKGVQYSRKLPRAQDVEGVLQIVDTALVFHATKGRVPMDDHGTIIGHNATFYIPDMTHKPAVGHLRLNGSGPINAVSTYLNTAPLSLMDKAKLPAQLGTGYATGTLDLTLPLIKDAPRDQVIYQGRTRVTGFSSQAIVKNHTISSPSLEIDYSNAQVTITGPAAFDGISGQGEFMVELPKGTPKLSFTSSLTPQALSNLGINLSFAKLSGASQVNGTLLLPKNQSPTLELSTSLEGMSMSIPMLNWSKGKSQSGDLTAKITLGRPLNISSLVMDAAGLKADLAVALNDGGKLDKVTIKSASLAGLGTISGAYRPARAGIAQFAIAGGDLDFRKITDGRSASKTRRRPAPNHRAIKITGQLDRLRLHDKLIVHNAQISSENINKMIQIDGRLSGIATVRSNVFDMGERIEVTAPDAGKVLDAMNLTTQIKDGRLRLALEQSAEHGGYDGALRVETFRLVKAPVLANILNAVSVIGILEQLNGEGVHFGELDANFSIRPDAYALHNMSAAGAAMGMSLRGTVDRSTNNLNMDGVVSPFYMLNAIGAPISGKGEGLFGVTFSIDGPTSNPKVGVNPLSLLAPGPLRDIFRKQIDTTQ